MSIIKQLAIMPFILSILSMCVGALISILTSFFKERENRKTQIELEKIKTYNKSKFDSYRVLYDFISTAYSFYWPPDDPEQDFSDLMHGHFFKKVKINYPFYEKSIREKLKLLESEYKSLNDDELIAPVPIKVFFKEQYLNMLNELNSDVEKAFDNWGIN